MATNYPVFDTLIEFFYHWESTTPNKVFLRQPKGSTWKTLTFAEAGQEARKMATALAAIGMKKGRPHRHFLQKLLSLDIGRFGNHDGRLCLCATLCKFAQRPIGGGDSEK